MKKKKPEEEIYPDYTIVNPDQYAMEVARYAVENKSASSFNNFFSTAAYHYSLEALSVEERVGLIRKIKNNGGKAEYPPP